MSEKVFLTKKETAEFLKVHLSTINNWIKNDYLIPYGIGGRIYFLKNDVINAVKPITVHYDK